jgi:DNA-binding CsgD family transcriptional regulator
VLLDDQDRVVSVTPSAKRWLRELVDVGQPADRRLPAPVYAVAARARGLAANEAAEPLQARARAFTRGGRWLLLHGAQLDGSASGLTAVIVEPARPADVVPLVIRAYGLSEREQEVTHLVLRGLSTKEVARRLDLSPLTVQHYLKVVFERIGVRSRGELAAQVLAVGR